KSCRHERQAAPFVNLVGSTGTERTGNQFTHISESHMEITVKILGDNLYSAIEASKTALDTTFLRLSPHADPISITIEKLAEPLAPDSLLASPDQPAVVLVHSDNSLLLDRLQSFDKREPLIG